MIFLFSTKAEQTPLPNESKVCPNCMAVTNHTVIEVNTRFAVYLIPLFSIKREVVYHCDRCGDTHIVEYADYEASVIDQSTPGVANDATVRQKAAAVLKGKVAAQNPPPPDLPSPPIDRLLSGLWIALALIAILAIGLFVFLFAVT